MDIRSKVIEIIADQAIIETSDVNDESTLEGLGIDSLGLVESIFAIEEAFDILEAKFANHRLVKAKFAKT